MVRVTFWIKVAKAAAALGFSKAMIIIGHEQREESGIKRLATRLQLLLKGTLVNFPYAGESINL